MKAGKIRFNSIFVSYHVPRDPRIKELRKWCGKFQKYGLTPEFEGHHTGNLSFRSKEGFTITSSGMKNRKNLPDESFVCIKDYDTKTNTFYVEGNQTPSSESLMHHLIYITCKEINSVFHGHNDLIVAKAKKMGLSVTKKEYESGTVDLAKEVLNVLGDNKFVVLKNHGFVSVGKTMNEAGSFSLSTLRRSKEVNKST